MSYIAKFRSEGKLGLSARLVYVAWIENFTGERLICPILECVACA